MLNSQVLIGTLIVIPTVVFHVAALISLSRLVDRMRAAPRFESKFVADSVLMGTAVLVILLVHTFEAWVWAVVYHAAGEFADLTQAVYFSIVTATTLGYGDITLSEEWRLVASFEAMGGLILFGASTAFLIEVMRYFFTAEQ